MIDEPRIVQTQRQHTAVIHLTIPREQVREVMGPGLSEVIAAVAAQGMSPSGPWFTHHLSMHPKTFDFEVGVPVPKPITAAGRVRPSQLPATKAAKTIFQGDYEGLEAAWQEFDAWVQSHGFKPRPDLIETYVLGPEADPDPAHWRTELTRPLF